MKNKRTDAIVGFVILISLIILIFGVLWLKGASVEKKQTLIASFADVGNLTAGDPVVVNGVSSGKVAEIKQDPESPRVLVVLRVNASIGIPKDSKVNIENVGLMGEQRAGLKLGNSDTLLAQGKVMMGSRDAGIAEAMGMMGVLFMQLDTIVQDLKVIIENTVGSENFTETFQQILTRIDNLSVTLEALMDKNKPALNQSVENLRVVSRDIRSLLNKNSDKIDNIVNNFSDVSNRTGDLMTKLDNVIASLESLMNKVEKGEGTLGKLLEDETLHRNIKELTEEADSLLKRINRGKR
jgi:phospholipid/cholesterol/gamma-HCH transport system substrate-binding protein